MNLKLSNKKPKTKIGFLLCWLGLHWWQYHCYRTCKRCGRSQTLYENQFGDWWED